MRILDRAPGSVLSLRMVAREAGVAAPSIYAHFADAQQLIAEIARECWQQLADEMAEASQSTAPGDPIGRIEAELGAYVRYAMERPSRYQMLFALPVANAREPSDLPALVQPAFRMVRDSLRALRDSGGAIPGSTSFEATMLLTSLVHGRIALASLAPEREGNSTAMVTDFVLSAISRLLSPSEASHARSTPEPAPTRRKVRTRELLRPEEPQ